MYMYAYFPASPPPELIVKHLPEYHFIGPSQLGPNSWQKWGIFQLAKINFPLLMEWEPKICIKFTYS